MASGCAMQRTAGGPDLRLERKWQLAHASPMGGYIVEEVTRTILGTKPDGSPITPSSVKYWQAWQVPAGSNVPEQCIGQLPKSSAVWQHAERTPCRLSRDFMRV